jgi:hypothetical protein
MGISARLLGKLRNELAKIVKPEIISISKLNGVALTGTRVSNFTHISFPENLLLGNHVFIGHFNYIDCYKKTVIEDGCQITNFISVLNHSSHRSMRLYGEAYTTAKDPKILAKAPLLPLTVMLRAENFLTFPSLKATRQKLLAILGIRICTFWKNIQS